jgi:hypothetical protein
MQTIWLYYLHVLLVIAINIHLCPEWIWWTEIGLFVSIKTFCLFFFNTGGEVLAFRFQIMFLLLNFFDFLQNTISEEYTWNRFKVKYILD